MFTSGCALYKKTARGLGEFDAWFPHVRVLQEQRFVLPDPRGDARLPVAGAHPALPRVLTSILKNRCGSLKAGNLSVLNVPIYYFPTSMKMMMTSSIAIYQVHDQDRVGAYGPAPPLVCGEQGADCLAAARDVDAPGHAGRGDLAAGDPRERDVPRGARLRVE